MRHLAPPLIELAALGLRDPSRPALKRRITFKRPLTDSDMQHATLEDPEAAAAKRPHRDPSTADTRPTTLREPPYVGGQLLHRSHQLYHKQGIIICYRCGFYAVTRANRLAFICSGHRNKAGGEYIRRWERGRTPIARIDLPESFPSFAEGIIWHSRP